MICENCGFKKHIFCTHECRDEYYKKQKKRKDKK
nr:MAG: hypothetical protein [uncultured archaeon]